MNRAWRPLAALGALIVAASFFLPPDFDRAPHGVGKTVLGMISSDTGVAQRVEFGAVAVVLVFPYVLAAGTVVTLLLGVRGDRWTRWLTLGCYSVGGLAITTVGIILIVTDDSFVSPSVRWYAAVSPAVLVGSLWVLSRLVAAEKILPALLLMTFGMQVPIQFILASMVAHHNSPAWGYGLGGGGATCVVIAALLGLISVDRPNNGKDSALHPMK